MATPPRALVHNWRLKASSVGLAVFLWALVQTEPRSEETFSSVPVRIEVADTLWTVSGPANPAFVQLRLDGPAREIIRLAREGTTLRVPVASVGSTDTVIQLRRDWVELGQRGGLIVESVSPTAISVSFERTATKLVPVAARFQGRIRENLAFAASVDVSPQLVRVRGPESRVLGLDSIPLQVFDLGRVPGSGVHTVLVDTTGLGGAVVVPASASLTLTVEDRFERVLDGLAVRAEVGPGQDDVVIAPLSIRLTLSGARTIVTSLDPALLRVRVPSAYVADMAPGEERRVRFLVEGVPEHVTAVPAIEYVTVRRAIDMGGEQAPGGP